MTSAGVHTPETHGSEMRALLYFLEVADPLDATWSSQRNVYSISTTYSYKRQSKRRHGLQHQIPWQLDLLILCCEVLDVVCSAGHMSALGQADTSVRSTILTCGYSRPQEWKCKPKTGIQIFEQALTQNTAQHTPHPLYTSTSAHARR